MGIESIQHEPYRPWRSALLGGLCAVLVTFPIAGICTLVYRFPIPFVGYRSGVEALYPAMLAVLFYGIVFAGLPLVALLGAGGGMIAGSFVKTRTSRHLAISAWAIVVASSGVLLLATLDKIIGPW